MGFCCRCGDIVVGPRCKCGGTPVAPVVQWNKTLAQEPKQDRWSKIYVHTSPTVSSWHPVSPIASTASQLSRPPSPLKHSTTLLAPEQDILLSPYTSTLSKVYGSILQPTESLTPHSCAICHTTFPPDSTIYPDPLQTESVTHFLCRACFTKNGGSKGLCPVCNRPVLTLKAEGGFVYAAGQYWHKRCFVCEGCAKNIGDAPVLDFLGRPSCPDCFDSRPYRDPRPPKITWRTRSASASTNIGGMNLAKKNANTGSRGSSPAIEELEKRLGIVKSKDSSPVMEELNQQLIVIANRDHNPIVSQYSSRRDKIYSPPSRLVARSENSPCVDRTRGRSNSCRSGVDRLYEPLKGPEVCRERSSIQQHIIGGTTTPLRATPTGCTTNPIRYTRTGGTLSLGYTATRKESPVPTEEAIKEMKTRFLRGSSGSSSPVLTCGGVPSPAIKPFPRSSNSLTSSIQGSESTSPYSSLPPAGDFLNYGSVLFPSTPDLDFSDTITQSSSSGSNSPLQANENIYNSATIYGEGYFPVTCGGFSEEGTAETKTSISNTISSFPNPSPSFISPVTCEKCIRTSSVVKDSGQYVTVAGDDTSGVRTYHTECFRCVACEGVFTDGGKGQAIFVKGSGGPCHLECVAPGKLMVRPVSNPGSTLVSGKSQPFRTLSPPRTSTSTYTSSRYVRPTFRSTSVCPLLPSSPLFPRFGGSTTCPGCRKSVSLMERGVVPGPQGSRWHATCLVCGGKKEPLKWGQRLQDKNNRKPGCGKRLDSSAKGDGDDGVWCRECWLLVTVGVRNSPQGSPNYSLVPPMYTGGRMASVLPRRVAQENTGASTTVIAQQYTGLGDVWFMRQLTGGGLSPTRMRPGSPTKGAGIGGRSRPKSVIGMRGKSVDEGRGMFLVRHMTGGTTT